MNPRFTPGASRWWSILAQLGRRGLVGVGLEQHALPDGSGFVMQSPRIACLVTGPLATRDRLLPGMPIPLIQRQLGHKRIETTMVYAEFHPAYSDVEGYFNQVDSRLGGDNRGDSAIIAIREDV